MKIFGLSSGKNNKGTIILGYEYYEDRRVYPNGSVFNNKVTKPAYFDCKNKGWYRKDIYSPEVERWIAKKSVSISKCSNKNKNFRVVIGITVAVAVSVLFLSRFVIGSK